jgi:signal transduction histidine kinase
VAHYGLSGEEITGYTPVQAIGLAFEALRNGQAIYRDCPSTSQPIRTSTMTFGLQHVAYIPMIAEQEVIGLIELAHVDVLEPLKRQYLEAAAQIIAYSVLILVNNIQIEKLLSEAQIKNTELLAREEELRQNLEELEATQEEMRRAQNELQKLNSNLETIVGQRTQELEVTLNELKNTQDQMVLNEKMSALGQLVAGIAHELNSPLGAIKASSESVLSEFRTVAENLPQLFVNLPTELQPLFLEVLQRLTRQRDDVHLSSREMRKLRKEIAGELEKYGLPENHAQDVASRLTEIGLISDIQPFYPLFVYDRVNLAEVLFAIGQLHINLDNIHVAAKRTQRIVYALKNYTHSSLSNEKQPTDLAGDIDTVLTLYTNQLKKGIDIVKRYDLHTPVPAFSDELNQVWTNFLQNAIQAMQGEGRLEIGVYKQDEHAVVEFIDSGPGMPPEVQARVFEAFYTTKAKGEGTGLGLNICRKIIDKHGGTINVESEPGRTRFWVTLPLAAVAPTVPTPQTA